MSLVKPDSTILTPKDGLCWRKLLVKLAPSHLADAFIQSDLQMRTMEAIKINASAITSLS